MVRIFQILRTMDVPEHRLELDIKDIRWLMRNLGVRNSNHPDFQEAMTLLKEEHEKLQRHN